MKKTIGEKNLLLIIALGGLAITLGICSMSGAGVATSSITFNNCIGHTETFEVNEQVLSYLIQKISSEKTM